MTTLTSAHAPLRSTPRRLWNVARLHLANPFTVFGTPAIAVGLIFAANWVIWWLIVTLGGANAASGLSSGTQYSGASAWIFVYMMVVAIMAMNHSFSFALGFGSTRRDFVVGSFLTFVGLSAGYALVYTALAMTERATNGWGLGGTMFDSPIFGLDGPWWQLAFHVFALFLFFFALGTTYGAIFVRWKSLGVVLYSAGLALVLLGAVVLITRAESWDDVWQFLSGLGLSGVYSLSLVFSVVAGLAGYLILRRATPRS